MKKVKNCDVILSMLAPVFLMIFFIIFLIIIIDSNVMTIIYKQHFIIISLLHNKTTHDETMKTNEIN